jgi:hypothetical protein
MFEKKYFLLALFLVAAFFLAGMDFFINGYEKYFKINSNYVLEEDFNFKKLQKIFPESIVLEKSLQTSTIFSRLDISDLLEKVPQMIFVKNKEPYLTAYYLGEKESSYFKIRTALEMILKKNDTIFDANNLGEYSLYFNDYKNNQTVYLLTFVNGRVLGFEYNKDNHNQIRKFLKKLAENKDIL